MCSSETCPYFQAFYKSQGLTNDKDCGSGGCLSVKICNGRFLFRFRRQYFHPGVFLAMAVSLNRGFSFPFEETILIRMYSFRNFFWPWGSVHGADGHHCPVPIPCLEFKSFLSWLMVWTPHLPIWQVHSSEHRLVLRMVHRG